MSSEHINPYWEEPDQESSNREVITDIVSLGDSPLIIPFGEHYFTDTIDGQRITGIVAAIQPEIAQSQGDSGFPIMRRFDEHKIFVAHPLHLPDRKRNHVLQANADEQYPVDELIKKIRQGDSTAACLLDQATMAATQPISAEHNGLVDLVWAGSSCYVRLMRGNHKTWLETSQERPVTPGMPTKPWAFAKISLTKEYVSIELPEDNDPSPINSSIDKLIIRRPIIRALSPVPAPEAAPQAEVKPEERFELPRIKVIRERGFDVGRALVDFDTQPVGCPALESYTPIIIETDKPEPATPVPASEPSQQPPPKSSRRFGWRRS